MYTMTATINSSVMMIIITVTTSYVTDDVELCSRSTEQSVA